MRYPEFENILSEARINRYLSACNGNTKKAMTLYRQNLRVSQELFTMIGCFEVALRNAIDVHCGMLYGNNWLREGVSQDGIFSSDSCRITAACIKEAIRKSATNALILNWWRNLDLASGDTFLQATITMQRVVVC
jgi:hypothetical protein